MLRFKLKSNRFNKNADHTHEQKKLTTPKARLRPASVALGAAHAACRKGELPEGNLKQDYTVQYAQCLGRISAVCTLILNEGNIILI